MKKLALDVNALHVEAFEVEPDCAKKGTMVANELMATLRTCNCTGDTCYPQFSCHTGNPCKPCVY